ncbi:MAG: amidohydrolase family protein [Polyangiales bacterium]
MPAIDDEEGAHVPIATATGGEIIDTHVHIFPSRVFEAIWRWFDAHAWSIRYRFHTEQVVEFLKAKGISAMVALHYSHKPGMAQFLNAYAAEAARAHRDFVWALGTVLPGEPGAADIVRQALGPLGLRGIKLHCHVQKIAADDPRMDEIYAACVDAGKPVLIHAGREPCSSAYGVDTHALCQAARIENVLQRFPTLRLVVPHLGADEYDGYASLLTKYEHLYLDTTMAVAGYITKEVPYDMIVRHADRLLYGTDFPNLPFAWDRELQRLVTLPLELAPKRALFSGNARRLFGG